MKKLTQVERRILESYKASNYYLLTDAYDRPSETKELIYKKHLNEFRQDKTATGYKIISFNGFMFTIGYTTIKDGITYLRYITKTKDELIRIENN